MRSYVHNKAYTYLGQVKGKKNGLWSLLHTAAREESEAADRADCRSLASLREGDSARVTGLLATGTMRRRLLDLGIVEGTRVECAQESPAGDPVAYAVRGAVIALRRDDARTILVL